MTWAVSMIYDVHADVQKAKTVILIFQVLFYIDVFRY